jgi:SsrA-binding protein
MTRVIENRKARHFYEIEETFEAGIVLKGSEVKALRQGRANIQDAYARLKNGEVFLIGAHISPYHQGGPFGHDPERQRKLLLKRSEIDYLSGRVEKKGMTLVPLKIYFNERNLAKVLLGLARGRKAHDRREVLKSRDARRKIERSLGRRRVSER